MAAAADSERPGSRAADYVIGDDPGSVAERRSLRDPAATGYPDHYSLRRRGERDNGHVHENSSIASHAFYLGRELLKARLAITLGKTYRQEGALRWGYLTPPDDIKSEHVKLTQRSRRARGPAGQRSAGPQREEA